MQIDESVNLKRSSTIIHFPLLAQILSRGEHLEIPRHVAQFHFLAIKVQLVNPTPAVGNIFIKSRDRTELLEGDVEDLMTTKSSIADLPIGFTSRIVRTEKTTGAGVANRTPDDCEVGPHFDAGWTFAVNHFALTFAFWRLREYVVPPMAVVTVLLERLDEMGAHGRRQFSIRTIT